MVIHRGWFQETVPHAAREIGPLAVLRLDGDWYESTRVCLEHLFDNVVEGGVIIIDDYGTFSGCRMATDEFFASRGIHAEFETIDGDVVLFWKGRLAGSRPARRRAPTLPSSQLSGRACFDTKAASSGDLLTGTAHLRQHRRVSSAGYRRCPRALVYLVQ